MACGNSGVSSSPSKSRRTGTAGNRDITSFANEDLEFNWENKMKKANVLKMREKINNQNHTRPKTINEVRKIHIDGY